MRLCGGNDDDCSGVKKGNDGGEGSDNMARATIKAMAMVWQRR